MDGVAVPSRPMRTLTPGLRPGRATTMVFTLITSATMTLGVAPPSLRGDRVGDDQARLYADREPGLVGCQGLG